MELEGKWNVFLLQSLSDKNCVYYTQSVSVFNIHWLGNIINQQQ